MELPLQFPPEKVSPEPPIRGCLLLILLIKTISSNKKTTQKKKDAFETSSICLNQSKSQMRSLIADQLQREYWSVKKGTALRTRLEPPSLQQVGYLDLDCLQTVAKPFEGHQRPIASGWADVYEPKHALTRRSNTTSTSTVDFEAHGQHENSLVNHASQSLLRWHPCHPCRTPLR